jgi:hypothetical protein
MTRARIPEVRPVQPPPLKPGVVVRLEGIYEVDPKLMSAYPQQHMPVWDTLRIVHAREDYLEWMHGHFAPRRWSAERDQVIDSGFERQGFTAARASDRSDQISRRTV